MAYETTDPELLLLRMLLLPTAKDIGAVLQRVEWAAEVLNVSPTEDRIRRLACLLEAKRAIYHAEQRLALISVEEAKLRIAQLVEEAG